MIFAPRRLGDGFSRKGRNVNAGSYLKCLADAAGSRFSSLWLWNLSYLLSITYPSFYLGVLTYLGGFLPFLTPFFLIMEGQQ